MLRSMTPKVIGLLMMAGLAAPIAAAERPATGDVWKIELGKPVQAIPDGFADFACGSNGGPPAQLLGGFAEFMKCAPEANGWREVYFRYDDELEYWAKANNFDTMIAAAGTKVYDLPVVMSILVAADGTVEGLRLFTDPRDTSVRLDDARYLYPFLLARFRPKTSDWTCKSLPPANGETPVSSDTFLKDDCTLTANGRQFAMSARYLRRSGERQIDPHTGKFTEGQFESSVRFEMHLS
ncbi:MAG: hypothetical protein JWN11_2611 [Hyphomicrobiales bacterium]|nr:hypothetical protein [Hyphomicrobiales bacterium]